MNNHISSKYKEKNTFWIFFSILVPDHLDENDLDEDGLVAPFDGVLGQWFWFRGGGGESPSPPLVRIDILVRIFKSGSISSMLDNKNWSLGQNQAC